MVTLENNEVLGNIHAAAKRSLEIRQAAATYPGLELGLAYKKWKEAKGETAVMLRTSQNMTKQNEITAARNKLRSRPCTRQGCNGFQFLESVCRGCIEGKAGYKSKWTCDTCMTRDLSREDINEWILKLSSG